MYAVNIINLGKDLSYIKSFSVQPFTNLDVTHLLSILTLWSLEKKSFNVFQKHFHTISRTYCNCF